MHISFSALCACILKSNLKSAGFRALAPDLPSTLFPQHYSRQIFELQHSKFDSNSDSIPIAMPCRVLCRLLCCVLRAVCHVQRAVGCVRCRVWCRDVPWRVQCRWRVLRWCAVPVAVLHVTCSSVPRAARQAACRILHTACCAICRAMPCRRLCRLLCHVPCCAPYAMCRARCGAVHCRVPCCGVCCGVCGA